jgi:cell division septum initiation protein DivIVA
MRLSDENTREGRHLMPEERIALQAEEIKQLWQENEQLQAQVARMREAIQEFADTANILTGSNESIIAEGSTYWKFKQVLSDTPAEYHNPADVEALRKAREALYAARVDVLTKETDELARDAVEVIDALIGGKEDV